MSPDSAAAPIILDIEASGFGPNGYPIEIGIALPGDQSFCSMIRPEPQWTHWSLEAEAIHHISRETLRQHGRPAIEVAHELNRLLAGKTVYSDGWAHDYSWLAQLFDVAGSVPHFRLDNLRTLLTEEQATHWHPSKDQITADLALDRHRASANARILQLTVLRLIHGSTPPLPAAGAHEAKLIEEMAELDALTLFDLIVASRGHCERAWLRERHAALLAGGGRILAERLKHRLAGYVALRPVGEAHWEIVSVNLHPWYRSTGLYRRLLIRTVALLLSHGAHTLSSQVLPGHEVAIRFHEKLGFARERETPQSIHYTIRVVDLARRLRQA